MVDSASNDNMTRILAALWCKPSRSRQDVARELSLDKSTLSRLVARLLDDGLLVEAEEGNVGPQGGRRPVQLAVRGDWGLQMGVDLQPAGTRVLLVDLAGEVRLDYKVDPKPPTDSIKTYISALYDHGQTKAKELGIPLRGLSVAYPSIVRPSAEIVERSSVPQIHNSFDVLSDLNTDGLAIELESDIVCCCRAEIALRKEANSKHFLFLWGRVEESVLKVSLGIVIDGRVHRGDHGVAGQFRNVKSLQEFTPSNLWDISEDSSGTSEYLASLFHELMPYITTASAVLDVDTLILGGIFSNHFAKAHPIFMDALTKACAEPTLSAPQVLSASRGADLVAFGAAVRFPEYLSQVTSLAAADEKNKKTA